MWNAVKTARSAAIIGLEEQPNLLVRIPIPDEILRKHGQNHSMCRWTIRIVELEHEKQITRIEATSVRVSGKQVENINSLV